MHRNDNLVTLSSDQGVQIAKTGSDESFLCEGAVRLQELLCRQDELGIKDARFESSYVFCERLNVDLILLIRNVIYELHGFRLLRVKRLVVRHDLFHCFSVLLHQPLLGLVKADDTLAVGHIQL